jgi:microsomal dipeptidase-like Zn-dependent dipeptidase
MRRGFSELAPRAVMLAVIVLGLSACGGSSAPDDAPGGGPVAPQTQTIYSVANACWLLQSEAGFVSADTAAADYGLTPDRAQATAFYFKPTALGSYLLLSAYSREPGEQGSKSLLGISDPAGEFLDELGNFVGELGFLVGGVGDITDIVLDPLGPGGGIIRPIGDQLGGVGGGIGGINVNPQLAMVDAASDLAVWNLVPAGDGRFSFSSAVTGQKLAASNGVLALTGVVTEGIFTDFALIATEGCDAYPEVSTNARIVDVRGPAKYLREVPLFTDAPGVPAFDGDDVFGYVDAHAHVTAYEFIGGRVNYGDPFHKFGIDHALGDCAVNHGPQGILGIVETATSGFNPVHETRGWPDFPFWPRSDSLQHHQTYYKWIERAWLGGMRLLVNHYTGNELLCQLNPQKENDCDFEANWRLQAQRLHEMQDYIDAHNGGPGKGWLRIVDNPADARAVIADGKLAVVQGIEISKVFNCGEFLDQPECSREQIVERLDAAYAAGVRHIFPVHKFDNALGGVYPTAGFGIGTLLHVGNMAETGHLQEFEPCPEDYEGPSTETRAGVNPLGILDQLLYQLEFVNGQISSTAPLPPLLPPTESGLCNIRGLTELGRFFVEELMRRGMFIEVDHISSKGIDRVLEIVEANGYPGVISSHDWTYVESFLDRIVAGGGTIGRFAADRARWVDILNRANQRPSLNRVADVVSTGVASDVNGIANLPGNGSEPMPLYPFRSVDGRVEFDEQVTGDHVFNLYEGRGVAHYGLYPDQIEDMRRYTEDRTRAEIEQALRAMFSSAEAYLRQWEAVEAWRQ